MDDATGDDSTPHEDEPEDDEDVSPLYEEIDELELDEEISQDVSIADIVEFSRRGLSGAHFLPEEAQDDPEDLKLASIRLEFVDKGGIQRVQSWSGEGYDREKWDD